VELLSWLVAGKSRSEPVEQTIEALRRTRPPPRTRYPPSDRQSHLPLATSSPPRRRLPSCRVICSSDYSSQVCSVGTGAQVSPQRLSQALTLGC
jgi:hypothetical protein